jgi:hypothetical protein
MTKAALALPFLILPALASAQTPGLRFSGDARAFAGYFIQQSLAGTDGVTSTSWVMGSAEYTNRGRAMSAHVMLSPDVVVHGDCAQPRLLPESFDCGDGKAVSHPLVMDLGVRAHTKVAAFDVALAAHIVGEPAFGPAPHFMRASAAYDPGAPLMHHFFTPSHSAHGLLTATVARGRGRVEASAFNGSTTADRYRIDLAPLHASALRFTWQFAQQASLQLSGAYFPAEETGAHHGHAGIMRAYSISVSGARGSLNYTAGCAAHHTSGNTPAACLLENTVAKGSNVFFGRLEGGRRLDQVMEAEILPDGAHAHVLKNYMLSTGEVAVGYARLLPVSFGWSTAVGARVAVTSIPQFFEARYVERRPVSLLLYVSARPILAAAHH